jgi:ankyrin repeat protein
MRFLHITANGSLSLVERPPDSIPPYAILSHTWGPINEEVTFQDFLGGVGESKVGYRKLALCGRQAALDGFEYFWSDTCCIDKTSSAELSEAINSMYAWYQDADVCYAYLADIRPGKDISKSRWFTRGWTLQELLAPSKVEFFDRDWNPLGTIVELQSEVSACTRIPTSMLSHEKRLETFSVAQRMSWAAGRKTTRIEDMAYCLMGVFDINMPLIYGEGENAFIRLQEEIMKTSDDHSLFAWQSSDNRGGCLATSPASFRRSGEIVQSNPLVGSHDPTIVSSKGVHLNVRFRGVGSGRLGYAILNCLEQGNEDERIAIYLRDMSLTMDYLDRVRSREIVYVNVEAFVSSQCPIRRLCIRKMRIRSKRKAETSSDNGVPSHQTVVAGAQSRQQPKFNRPKNLLEAVQSGLDDDVWLFLTRQDIEVNAENEHKESALYHATANGRMDIIQMLISRADTNINSRDRYGRTPLWRAIENEHTVVAKLLLETGKVDVNAVDEFKVTPLLKAVLKNDITIIQLLLRTGRIDVEQADGNGRTPLSWAVMIRFGISAGTKHMLEATELLLEVGKANVEVRDIDGCTPLILATKAAVEAMAGENYFGEIKERMEIVRLLLRVGMADANSRNNSGKTSLSFAAEARGHNVEPLRRLLLKEVLHNSEHYKRRHRSTTPLMAASKAGDMAVMRLLLGSGEDNVNSSDWDGMTSLTWAVRSEQELAVQLLLEVDGIYVDTKDVHGRTPLSWAAEKASGDDTIVRFLLDTGKVDVNSRDNNGRSPLMWAVRAMVDSDLTDDLIVALLLKTPDVELDLVDVHGRTPLSLVVEAAAATPTAMEEPYRRYVSIIDSLIGSGKVDVDSKDGGGRTPLSWAATQAASLQAKQGAAMNGGYRLHIDHLLMESRGASVMNLLLKTGRVNANLRDNQGRSPLSWAVQEGKEADEVCHFLATAMGYKEVTMIRGKGDEGSKLLSEAIIAGDEMEVGFYLRTRLFGVNETDRDGQTPLSRAIRIGNEAITKQLVDGNADVNLKDKKGLTPLSWAIIRGNVSAIHLLLSTYRVDVDLKEKDGYTPWTRAKLPSTDPAVLEAFTTYGYQLDTSDE